MAKTNFFKDSNGLFHIGSKVLGGGTFYLDYYEPSGAYQIIDRERGIILESSVLATEFAKENGTCYTDIAEVLSACKEFFLGTQVTPASTKMFVSTANKNIANTSVKTTMLGTGVGTKTIPANSLKVGDVINIDAAMVLNTAETITNILGVMLNDVDVVASSGAFTGAQSDLNVMVYGKLIVRSIGETGTVVFVGSSESFTAANGTPVARGIIISTPVVIDTTIDQVVDLTYTFGAENEGNTLAVTSTTITK